MATGVMDRLLEVDLTEERWEVKPIDQEMARQYLGGKGIGTKILYDETRPGIDPLGPDNVLIFAAGPVTGTGAPQSNRFTVTAKSPHTGLIGTSTCGGDLATKMKRAGFDVLVIKGQASRPLQLRLEEGKVSLQDASDLWGLGTVETQARLPKTAGMAVIGPAGENKVTYASIASGHRMAGRTGMGAVMGSKNLKAIVAEGKERIEPAWNEDFKDLRKRMTAYLRAHPMTGQVLPALGTANLVNTTAGRNILPVKNFSKGSDPRAGQISGEEMAARHLERNDGCLACPIQCGRVVRHKGAKVKGPEYETIGLLGSNLGNFDMERLFTYASLCDDLGLDSISTGGVIGYVMEASQRGMMSAPLAFGSSEGVEEVIRDIAYQRGLGVELGRGVRPLSQRIGGEDFAIHVKGLELPAYDPRGCYGQGLEYATTNRGGCHIQGATMFLEATGPVSIDPHSIKAKPELVIMQQNLFAAIGSMVMCCFSAYAMIPPIAFKLDPHGLPYRALMKVMLNSGPLLRVVLSQKAPFALLWFEKFVSQALGRHVSMGEFMEIGERIFNLERLYNIREGATAEDDDLPVRLKKESIFPGIQGGVPLDSMLPHYYKVRGWDERGVPTAQTIKRLGIRV